MASTGKQLRRIAERQRLVLAHYTRLARPVLREYMTASSCIASTRVTLDVLHHFGLHGTPVPVVAIVLNPPAARLMYELGRYPEPEEQEPVGGWIVSVGYPKPPEEVAPDDWNGHLAAGVVMADGTPYLVDASIDQADRPARNIALPGVMVGPVSAEWLDCKQELVAMTPDGCHVVYSHRPDAPPYEVSPDWANRNRYARPTLQLIRTLEREVA